MLFGKLVEKMAGLNQDSYSTKRVLSVDIVVN